MTSYIYDDFKFTKEYKNKVIEILKHNCNVEIGGYKIYDGTGTHYMQKPEEIMDLVFYCKQHELDKKFKIKSFLEIGYSAGINNTFLNKFFNFENNVAVDIVDNTPNPRTFFNNLRFKNFTLICGDSTKETTIERVKKLGTYDLIFIDGGHTYDIVTNDYINYSKVLSSNGVIAFHDITANGFEGVGRFWEELKTKEGNKWNFHEFIDPFGAINYGIGVITRK